MPRVGKEAAAALVSLHVHNATGSEAWLVWVPDTGEPVEYASVSSDGELVQQSNIGHRWQIRAADGSVLAELVTTGESMQTLSAGLETAHGSSAGASSSSSAASSSSSSAAAAASVPSSTPPSDVVSLAVHNATAEPLALVWMPEGGSTPKEYAQLCPGDRMHQLSAVGHLWMLRTAGGEVVAETVTTSASGQQLVAPGADGAVDDVRAPEVPVAAVAPTTSPESAGEEAASAPPSLVAVEVYNGRQAPLRLFWLPDGDAAPIEYSHIPPGDRLTQQSSVGHRWQLRGAGGAVEAEVVTTTDAVQHLSAGDPCLADKGFDGAAAPKPWPMACTGGDEDDVAAAADRASDGCVGCEAQRLLAPADGTGGASSSSDANGRDAHGGDTHGGDTAAAAQLAERVRAFYAQSIQVGVAGIRVRSSAAVAPSALEVAATIVRAMLRDAPSEVLESLRACGCTVAVIGRDESASDIPEHAATCVDAAALRAVADRTRGLGGTRGTPVTSCGEENLLCLSRAIAEDRHYPNESILVHEFGHTVMNCGLDARATRRIHECYEEALASGLVVVESYMGSNADEYWAEGCQAWFMASARADVNEGMLTRGQLRRYDPGLASCLAAAFGDDSVGSGRAVWSFTTDELVSPSRERWMQRQTTYLLMRHLVLSNADALADVLERVVRTA